MYRVVDDAGIHPDLNVERLDHYLGWAAVEAIKKSRGLPSEWDQAKWIDPHAGTEVTGTACGTACCVAGKIALDAGATFDSRDYTYVGIGRVQIDGSTWEVMDYSKNALGLNYNEGVALFNADNDIDELFDIVQKIKNGEFRETVNRFEYVSECNEGSVEVNDEYYTCDLPGGHAGEHLYNI